MGESCGPQAPEGAGAGNTRLPPAETTRPHGGAGRREGRLSGSLWYSQVGPDVSSLQDPLSASFRGTLSSTSGILLMESGLGRNGALLASGEGGLGSSRRTRPGQVRQVGSSWVSEGTERGKGA